MPQLYQATHRQIPASAIDADGSNRGASPLSDLGSTYVKHSKIHGGGAFASRRLRNGEPLCKYTGVAVAKETLNASGYPQGYVMRRGGCYVDARDPNGRLVLQNGSSVDVHDFTDADWAALPSVGVRWDGVANLSRFINRASEKGKANVVFRKGWWRPTREVEEHEELVLSARTMPHLPDEHVEQIDASDESVDDSEDEHDSVDGASLHDVRCGMRSEG
jgi:hypothetical protein